MFSTISNRAARRGSAVLAAGLLLGVVPGVATGVAQALPKATVTVTPANATYSPNAQAIVHISVSPDRSGKQVKLQVQRFVSGSWFNAADRTDTLPAGSAYDSGYTGAAGGKYRFNATFLGDSEYAKTASNWANFTYTGKETDLDKVKVQNLAAGNNQGKDGYKTYAAGAKVTWITTVSPNRSGGASKFHLQKLVGKKWTTVTEPTRKLDSQSRAAYTLTGGKAGTSYRAYADYVGDAHTGRAASPYTYVRFNKNVVIKHSVTPTKASGGYFVYKAGKKVTYTVAVSPNKKGKKVTVVVQHAKGSKWVADGTASLTLNAKSAASIVDSGQPAGAKFRFKATYAGDAANGGATTSLLYIRYVK